MRGVGEMCRDLEYGEWGLGEQHSARILTTRTWREVKGGCMNMGKDMVRTWGVCGGFVSGNGNWGMALGNSTVHGYDKGQGGKWGRLSERGRSNGVPCELGCVGVLGNCCKGLE